MKIGTTDITDIYIGTTQINEVYIGTTKIFPNLLLDDYTGAEAAYSVRKLRTAYSGSCLRVRRSSDNTEQDIGFSSNVLDTSTMETFCSGTNGFIVTWYDQSGNGNNLTQSVASEQPQIVSSGSTLLENTKPCIQFDGSNDGLYTSSVFGVGSTRSVFSVIKGTGNGTGYENYYMFLEALPSTSGDFLQVYSNDYTASIIQNYVTAGLDITSSTAINTQQILTVLKTSTTSAFYQNGSSTGSGTGTQSLEGVLTVGEYSGNYANAKFQEIIVWNTDQTSNRSAIESNINTYYGVY